MGSRALAFLAAGASGVETTVDEALFFAEAESRGASGGKNGMGTLAIFAPGLPLPSTPAFVLEGPEPSGLVGAVRSVGALPSLEGFYRP